MKVVIINEKHNPHMARRELIISVEHVAGSTPSRAGLQHLIARELNLDAQQVDIKSIFSSVGKQQSRAKVFVWNEKRAEDLSKPKPQEEKKEEVASGEAN